MVVETHHDWSQDTYWNRRRLSPAQLLIHDIDYDHQLATQNVNSSAGTRKAALEINEVLVSTLLPSLSARNRLYEEMVPERWTANREKQQLLRHLANEFGWMNCLRREETETVTSSNEHMQRCRWIHISSKFTEYLAGSLLALSDRTRDPEVVFRHLYQLDRCMTQHERYSKHGKYFAPFCQELDDQAEPGSEDTPQLLSLPFLDWTTAGTTPPLRFQVDAREGYQSSKSSCHLLRSILQSFYRLEDTTDREQNQVFTKHKPWLTDRDLDLKVRRWYGHYPSALNVDELILLIVDSRHIITFSSNQTWKSRWPPLQIGYNIAENSFRNIRNKFFKTEVQPRYNSSTHLIACISGAVGLLHRSFWEIPLCLTDRYAGYLGHLQFRLHRSPNTRLVMELLQVQEELNIVLQITEQQIQVIKQLKARWEQVGELTLSRSGAASPSTTSPIVGRRTSAQEALRNAQSLVAPISELLETLQREYLDLSDLRDNCNTLFTRTIQLVNIRMEDHGKAILVFTIVTIIFLPLSFVASYLGMNTSDIRGMNQSQGLFWIIAGALTAGTVAIATFLAFYGAGLMEAFFDWRAGKLQTASFKRRLTDKRIPPMSNTGHSSNTGKTFEILDGSFGPGKPGFLSGLR